MLRRRALDVDSRRDVSKEEGIINGVTFNYAEGVVGGLNLFGKSKVVKEVVNVYLVVGHHEDVLKLELDAIDFVAEKYFSLNLLVDVIKDDKLVGRVVGEGPSSGQREYV